MRCAIFVGQFNWQVAAAIAPGDNGFNQGPLGDTMGPYFNITQNGSMPIKSLIVVLYMGCKVHGNRFART